MPALRFSPLNRVRWQTRQLFSTLSDQLEFADRCNANIISSPYAPIPTGPYSPLFEFVAQRWKDLSSKVAIVDGATDQQRTFDDYYHRATGLAASLSDMGLTSGGTVALFSPNHVDYLPSVLAVSLCGAKLTPINPLFSYRELETVLNRSRSSILITHESVLDTALQVARNCAHLRHILVLSDSGEAVPFGTIAWESVCHHEDRISETHASAQHSLSTCPVLLPYSSGTTGLPKGVCLTHNNIIANLQQFDRVDGPTFAADHKLISPLPFFHIFGLTLSLLYCAWKGNTLVTMSGRFSLDTFCRVVQAHEPQRGHLVPPILLQLAKDPLIDQYDLSSLQMLMSGAAPLGRETELAINRRIGCQVKQSWGMTELSPLGACNADDNYRSGSIGPLVASTIAKIVDKDGKSLGPNQHGELLLKGPQTMTGYHEEPEKTAECLTRSGWLRTGDFAFYDEDGYLYITDRIKELIKVRGYAVAPAELEALLLTHDAIQDAAVVQIEDEASGELPRAYIVLRDDAEGADEQAIYQWVKERAAPYKRLDGGIVFTSEIPKSASGKILRRVLRDRLEDQV